MPVYVVQYVYKADSDSQKNEVRPSHRDWLGEQYEQGNLLASGPLVDANQALLIWQYESAESLSQLLGDDPFAQHNLIENAFINEWTVFYGPWAQK